MNLERDRNVLFIILLLNCFIINTQISISNEEINISQSVEQKDLYPKSKQEIKE